MNIAISPSEAAQAGCSASYTSESQSGSDSLGTHNYTLYRLAATEVTGWRFSHFEWTFQEVSSRTYTQNKTQYDNPYPPTGTALSTSQSLYDGTYEWDPILHDSGLVDSVFSVTDCRAVFKPVTTGIEVIALTRPVSAGVAGCTALLENGNWAQTKTGMPGTTADFTMTATPAQGWFFVQWKDDTGAFVSAQNPLTVTKTFGGSFQEFSYRAIFGNGAILHGASGAILHGASGAILFSG